MFNAMPAKVLVIRWAIILGIAVTNCVAQALAQPVGSFSDHLLNRAAAPTPAAFHVRTNRLLVGVGGEVRKTMGSGAAGTPDADLVYGSRRNTVLRIRVDAQRERLWILDIGAVHVFDLAKNRRIRSVTLPNWVYAGHNTNCLPDLQLDSHGAAFVSDNLQPKLWRIDPENFSVHERSVTLDAYRTLDVGFSALTITRNGALYAAMAAPGLLWRIDTDLFRAENIPLSVPIQGACAMETLDVAKSRGFTLFVMSAGRSSFDVKRVTMAPGASVAFVDIAALASVAAPASLLEAAGTLYLARPEAALPVSRERRAKASSFALRPIYRLD
ncbi:MAG: hypothetical protein JWO70_3922 [Betaproteobacteria bacterium]|nr:hypothetical protein [Betaproteobacteria bacterium]